MHDLLKALMKFVPRMLTGRALAGPEMNPWAFRTRSGAIRLVSQGTQPDEKSHIVRRQARTSFLTKGSSTDTCSVTDT